MQWPPLTLAFLGRNYPRLIGSRRICTMTAAVPVPSVGWELVGGCARWLFFFLAFELRPVSDEMVMVAMTVNAMVVLVLVAIRRIHVPQHGRHRCSDPLASAGWGKLLFIFDTKFVLYCLFKKLQKEPNIPYSKCMIR